MQPPFSGEEYAFTLLTADDIPAIVALEKSCFSAAWTEEQYRLVVAAGGCRIFGAWRSGCLVAYLAAAMHPESGEMEIYNIAVAYAMRRRGLGRKLLTVALKAAAQAGAARAVLEVRRGNTAAVALYDSLGFVLAGVRPGYYQDTGEDGLIYARALSAGGR